MVELTKTEGVPMYVWIREALRGEITQGVLKRGEGIDASASLLTLEIIPARMKMAKALGIAVGDLVIRVKTLRYANHVPITVHDAHLPHKLFVSILNENLEVQHLWTLFEKCGYKVKRAIQRIEAREATKELAQIGRASWRE